MPGARRWAMSAASMAGVPLPHMGARNGVVPSHPVARMQAAASVSCIGALPGNLR